METERGSFSELGEFFRITIFHNSTRPANNVATRAEEKDIHYKQYFPYWHDLLANLELTKVDVWLSRFYDFLADALTEIRRQRRNDETPRRAWKEV